jgi:hypothetical protein
MACERYRDALSDVAAGAAVPTGVEAHLAACTACRAELAALRQALAVADDEMGRLRAVEPSPDLVARIRTAVAQTALAEPAGRPGWRIMLAAAAAAALLVALMVVAGRAPSREPALALDAHPPEHGSAATATEAARQSAVVAVARPDGGSTERPRVRPLRAVPTEPEVLVPPGELLALHRLAADLRRRTVTPDSLLLADLSAPLPEARDVLIRPLEIVPLSPEEDSGAE